MATGYQRTYALPFGHGKHFLPGASGLGNALISGWAVNSIVSVQGGFPFTPQLSYNPSNNGDTRNPVRPFVNPTFSGPVILGTPTRWFNPAAFLAPRSGSGFYGNLGRDTLIGPGLATWDLSFLKNTRIRERLNLQFRAELFNLLNRANFNTPNAIVFTPTASVAHGRCDYEHVDDVTAGSVRIEAALVTPSLGAERCRRQFLTSGRDGPTILSEAARFEEYTSVTNPLIT